MKILVCGFMGAGKSYWLQELAEKSSLSDFYFLDLDHEIAKALQISPDQLGDWIKSQGWPYFRKIEQEKLSLFINNEINGILALGGGAVTSDLIGKNLKNQTVKIVFLDTLFEVCHERITKDSNRPLVSLKKEELRKLYEERLPLYRQAHLILDERERKEIDGIGALVHTLYGPK
jgi:shikimate kinase